MVKNLKELQALLKLCQKQGVISFETSELKLSFGPLPARREATASEDAEPVGDTMTDEDLMFYSAGGIAP